MSELLGNKLFFFFFFFKGDYVLLKAPLLYSIQSEIVIDPAGVCLDLTVILKVSAEQLRARVYPLLCTNGSTTALIHSSSHRALKEINRASNTFLKPFTVGAGCALWFLGLFFFFSLPSFLFLYLRLQPPRSSHLSTSGAAASQPQRHQGFPFI